MKPNRATDGVPLCPREGCDEYDGKRCRMTGFRPSDHCEVALAEDYAAHNALKKAAIRLCEVVPPASFPEVREALGVDNPGGVKRRRDEDPLLDCAEFELQQEGLQPEGRCEGDGHYMCERCRFFEVKP